MNRIDKKYTDYALCNEMMETAEVIKNFNPAVVDAVLPVLESVNSLLLTGEGSSRIFPAKRAITENGRMGGKKMLFTEGSSQAEEYDLNGFAVFGASNSGRTKELINLFTALKSGNTDISLFGVTAHDKTPLTEISDASYVLDCGSENAVAATKSVVEQALYYQALLSALRGKGLDGLSELSAAFETVLETSIPDEWIEKLVIAPRIYFAGRNDGVAEELTLKINEITRKPSDFLEGTYALHGVEEVMTSDEVLVLINPFEREYEMYQKNLEKGVGMTVLAVSDKDTPFPTLKIPESENFSEYLQLAAGWNLMVETGLALGINPDKPVRARKVGNSV